MYVPLQGDQDRFFSGVFFLLTGYLMAIRTSGAMTRAMHTHTAKIVGGPGAKRKSAKLTQRWRRSGVCLCLHACACACACVYHRYAGVGWSLYSSNGPHLYIYDIRSEQQRQLRESEQQLREMRSSSSTPLDSEKEHEETEEIAHLKATIKSMAHRQVCASVCVCVCVCACGSCVECVSCW